MLYGQTDEFGFAAIENKVHYHDLHATILFLLGLNHEHLTYRYSGSRFPPDRHLRPRGPRYLGLIARAVAERQDFSNGRRIDVQHGVLPHSRSPGRFAGGMARALPEAITHVDKPLPPGDRYRRDGRADRFDDGQRGE